VKVNQLQIDEVIHILSRALERLKSIEHPTPRFKELIRDVGHAISLLKKIYPQYVEIVRDHHPHQAHHGAKSHKHSPGHEPTNQELGIKHTHNPLTQLEDDKFYEIYELVEKGLKILADMGRKVAAHVGVIHQDIEKAHRILHKMHPHLSQTKHHLHYSEDGPSVPHRKKHSSHQ